MERPQDYVLRTVDERNIRLIQLWMTDVLGMPKALTITPAELENALTQGLSFDGSAIDGFTRVQESDMLAKPDPSTFQVLPWNDAEHPVARMTCDVIRLDGTPFEGDPRHVLRRALANIRARGLSLHAATEMEFFYLESGDPGNLKAIDYNTYFDLESSGMGSAVRNETVLALEDMGVPVAYGHHEDANGQHEIDLRYADAMTMADSVMSVRYVVKQIAEKRGMHATFMPKPFADVQGSGMHTHFSLFEGNNNVFYDADDGHGLSQVARGFIAGLLRHSHEMAAVTNQWVNSYKRLVRGFEAPTHVAWAPNNSSVTINVPHAKRPESTRVEFRSIDPATNPYLAFASVLTAGLRGIEQGYELPTAVDANLYEYTQQELIAEGVSLLPSSLSRALDHMETSQLMSDVLGEHVFGWFLRNKRAECDAYTKTITQYELDRYLARL